MTTTSVLDQLREALASDTTAATFIEAFLGLITNERKTFLEHLVKKLQFDDLYLVLQKASQRINGQKLVIKDSHSDVPKNVKIEVTTAFITAKEDCSKAQNITLSKGNNDDCSKAENITLSKGNNDDCSKAQNITLSKRNNEDCSKAQNITLTKRNTLFEKNETIKEEHEDSVEYENTININSTVKCEQTLNEKVGDHFITFGDESEDPLCGSDEDEDKMPELNIKNPDYEKQELQCNVCLKTFSNVRTLQQHMYSHQEGKHKCEFCDLKFNRPSKLKSHTRIHTGEKPFKCDECDCTFRDSNLLRIHHNREHVDKVLGPYFCDLCPLKVFSTTRSLSDHNQQSHNKAKFNCEFCDLKFNKPLLLKIHRRIHTGETPFKCNECDKSFRGKDLLRMHVVKVHVKTSNGPYSCDLCPLTIFSSIEQLKRHQQSKHLDEYFEDCKKNRCKTSESSIKYNTEPNLSKVIKDKLSCEECPKMFNNVSQLEDHMRKHTGETPYMCSQCPKSFTSQKALNVHEMWHEKMTFPVNMMCEICSKICTTRDQWNYHLKTHKEVTHQFKCDLCPDRIFSTMVNLRTHKRTHTKEKPFQCDQCAKSFAHNNSLQIHIRIHNGDRPFACEFCEKKFTDQTGLRKHIRKHTGERPYHCDNCDRSFTQCTQLKTHKCHAKNVRSSSVSNLKPNSLNLV